VPRRISALLDNPYFLLVFAGLCWSGNHVVGRAIAGHVPPLGISFLRWLVPVIVMWPFVRGHLRRDWPQIRAHWRAILFLTLTGGALFTVLQYVGLQHTTALNVSVLNSLSPVTMVAAAAVLFRDYMSPRQIAGVFVSLAGVLVVITRGDPDILHNFAFNKGDLFVIGSMTTWGVYSACLRLKPEIHWLSFLFIIAVVSAVASLPFAVAEAMSGFVLKFDLLTVFAVLYTALFAAFLAMAAWNRGVQLIGSNRAGPFLHLIAIYSAVLAGVFLGEHIGLHHVVGFVLILSGVWLAARRAASSSAA
jgi:drug/metabolite transporter (DMT)-like permease